MNDRKASELDLQKREERIRTFIENSTEAIWCIELDQPIAIDLPEDKQVDLIYKYAYFNEANDAYARMAGYERGEEMLGLRLDDIMPRSIPENIVTLKQIIRACYNIIDIESVEITKNGKSYILKNNVIGIIEDGLLMGAWGTSQNITAQKETEEKLRKAELLYRTVADFTYDWEIWENPEGKIIYISPSCERITGYSKENFTDDPELMQKIIFPEDRGVWTDHQKEVRKELGQLEVQFRISAKNGETRWIEHACQPVYDSEGSFLGIRASNRDITQRKLAEESLKKKDKSLIEAQRIAHLGSWEWDITNNELLWSDEVYRIFGLKPQQFGSTYEAFLSSVHPDDRKEVIAAVDRALNDSQSQYNIEHRVVRPDSSIRIVHEQAEVTFSKSGKAIRMIGTVHDITEQKQMEIKLIQQFEEIQQLQQQIKAEWTYLQEEIKLEHDFEDIIGNSDALKYVLYKVEEVAATDASVLIMGETGTGKELIARAIHSASFRKNRPLIKVNCAALPDHLIESELFGYEKGAFTGADSRRLGRFELSDGATLFLDEISEIPIESQGKLLQVLQDGEFERLGSSKTLRSDVRIIAASNRNLENEIKSGRFREDLWYRINVFPLTVPPLRLRKEDIPLLVNWFVDKFNRKMGKQIKSIPSELIEHLQTYDWPGNVRELENVIERAVITTQGTTLKLFEKLDPPRATRETASHPTRLAEVERFHILKILEDTHWKIEGDNGAAKALGVAPSTLRDRMKKLDIHRAIKR